MGGEGGIEGRYTYPVSVFLYNSIYIEDYSTTMRHFQDLHPYDSAILGLNNLYIVDSLGDFYINSPFIMATDKTLKIGTIYLLVDNYSGARIKMNTVKLIDCYLDDRVINLILQDISSQVIFTH
jgi:hypothetical protein